MVGLERGLGGERVDELEASSWTEGHGDGDGAIELDHRRWGELGELCVELDDARPARFLGGERSGMAGGDGGLECVRATAAAELSGTLERGKATADEELVPECAVLIEEEDGLTRAAERDAWISMSATRPWTSGSCGASSARMRPRRSASSQRAGRIQSSPAVAE